jgi:anti-anti-sigma factor
MTAIDLGAGFTITPTERDGYVCWEVTGNLDLFRSPRLSDAVAAACRRGRRRHLVDLTGVASMDASAVRVLITLHKLVRPKGQFAVAAEPGSDVWSVLNSTGAARILKLYAQRVEAVAALAPAADTAAG